MGQLASNSGSYSGILGYGHNNDVLNTSQEKIRLLTTLSNIFVFVEIIHSQLHNDEHVCLASQNTAVTVSLHIDIKDSNSTVNSLIINLTPLQTSLTANSLLIITEMHQIDSLISQIDSLLTLIIPSATPQI